MRTGGSRSRGLGFLLLVLALSLGAASEAHAQACSDFGGVLDGFAGDIPPSQLQIDQNCTVRNYPASNPLSTNFSFFTQPGQNPERWLIVFDNVVHTGQMSCNAVLEHKIWFTNGSSTSIQDGCQNLLIPVEKIDKQNPAGQTTAAIGVPFTYTLTIPVLFDPATGTVINSAGSVNDLHSVIITDDLNATGVDLTYLSHDLTWRGSGAPVPHSFSNAGGLLTFDVGPVIPAGEQIDLEITVVLEDTPTNSPGAQFINTAKWEFGRLIDGVFHQPLPGENGISPPLTIAAPQLVMTKTGPATLGLTLNLGEWGQFGLDVENTGLTDAWEITLLDQLPDDVAGGMCATAPEILSAEIFESGGGTRTLVQGSDYTLAYVGAPTCELTLGLLTAAGPIGPGERLVVSYRTRLDPDTQEGAALTNVAGATEWFNDQAGNPDRVTFTRTLTDGTPGDPDHEDAHTVTAALFGLFFEKSVANQTTGANPTATATPGDTLRYTLRVQATDVELTDLTIRDDLGALNASPVFVPGSLAVVAASIPPGATDNSNPGAGTNGAGLIDVSGLNVPVNGEVRIDFDIQLDSTLADGTLVLNQADLFSAGVDIADSDDPNLNGQADPSVPGDEDPTQVLVEATPPEPLLKANTQGTATIGEEFSYLVTLPSTPHTAPLFDVRILDDLTTSAADLEFVSVSRVSGPGSWAPVNSGSATNLVIEDPTNGIDVPADEQIVVEITVRLLDTGTNVAGLAFTNTATFTYDLLDGDSTSERPGAPGTTGPMTIVEPRLTLQKSGPALMTLGTPGSFSLDVHNAGDSPAWTPTLTDRLPDGPTGGTCDTAPANVTAQVFESDGSTPVSGVLVQGTDYSLSWSGEPGCLLSLSVLSDQGTIGADQRLIIGYEALLDGDTPDGVTLTNVAGAVEWFSLDASSAGRRTYSEIVTDGTPGVLDHEDAHTVGVALPAHLFEKTVMNVTTGADPATNASPGDVLRYRLRLENPSDEPLADLAIVDELDALNAPAAFQAGTLQLVSVPAGATTGGTDPAGGAQGTGLLDVRDLAAPAQGSLTVEFEITLAPVLANGSVVANQSQLLLRDAPFALSDDPNQNGPADPFVPGDEDPTRVVIQSAPAFRVQKISDVLTGDPNVLLPGETLRYTITVKNVGTDDATGVTLRDDVPLNATYVAGSTTLNGAVVPDGAGGASPLVAGIPIHAPEDPTPGAMRADASATPDNVATLTFDVVIDAGVPDGTVISNQGVVNAPGNLFDTPSDDPTTPIPDDPTRDVVGSVPLLFATKSVTLLVDNGSPGVVDPLDVLHYAIQVFNTGAVPATGVVVTDGVPADTSYVQNSTRLNGLPVGQPDGGSSPLAAGVPISSSDLTPPLPGPGGGTLSVGESALLEFDLEVAAGTPGGTIISNQAVVSSDDPPDLLTDGDGDPTTGPEPTQVVVGDGQQLSIAKQVAVVGGGPALPGSTLEYLVNVHNIGAVPAVSVVITDDLDDPVAGQLAYVASSASLNGSPIGVSFLGTTLTADYSGSYGALEPGDSIQLRFRAVVDPGLPIGTTVTNVGVVTWNAIQTAQASVSVDLGGIPGVGVLSGRLWHDADFDDVFVDGDTTLEGWIVELLQGGALLQSTVAAADGMYRIEGLAANDAGGDPYVLRFRAPDAGANSAALGLADSAFTNGPQEISDIVVSAGSVLPDLNLPIDPNGVVYGALQRTPIPGATLSLLRAGSLTPVSSLCFDGRVQQGQVTRGDGFYKFDLNFSDASCPVGGSYVIGIAAPGAGFEPGYSQIIPPSSDPLAPLDVPTCPGGANDAVAIPTGFCESQALPLAPTGPETAYYVHLTLDDGAPGSSQIFNNHIPLDPVLDGVVAITKTTPSVNVSRGQLVPYEITVRNAFGAPLDLVEIRDRFPAGFHYVKGSARIDGVPSEPTILSRELTWSDLVLPAVSQRRLQLLLAVGAGVSEGEFTNRALALRDGTPLSGEALATVRVVPDPTFDCTDVLGKVFDDADRDGAQDRGERGLPGVRLVTARGLIATTDAHGRFHITCAIVPRDGRGSNFVLKLDDRSLPSGYRMSTRQVQVKRATRGKALRFNYGASIHRVVGLDLANAVFEPGSAEMRPQWRSRLGLLLDELAKAPAILRLSYLADVEDEELVERRLAAIKREIAGGWDERDGYELTIETEIFWRRGTPVDVPSAGRTGEDDPEPPPPPVSAGPPPVESAAGEAAERHFSGDTPFAQWVHDPELLSRESGDRLEEREVLADAVNTVKLKDVVPPVRFDSGVAQISPSYIEKLREVLGGMRHLRNVRLHLVGHADDEPLSGALSRLYGDNAGLSRERAGELAEFIQRALALPPDAISFEWAGDSQPIASNATEAGRALNRRVEVEVWYDEIGQQIVREEVVVPAGIKRVKVCRVETVCKLRYREGHARRARVKNLIAPLRYDEESVGVPAEFIRQVEQALGNLRDKQNVTVKLIGFTDDVPLTGRAERIFGTHMAFSKARAHRVARAVQEALDLPSREVTSSGLGVARPLASNATERGRALNRRIEVEFWYDDPLQELPDEPQPCPDPATAERVTVVYDPPWGRIEPLSVENGEAEVPPGYADDLRRAMADVADRDNVRLRFVGYTHNERLERRTAAVYGDDIGLSAARARRVMQTLQSELELADARVEHEGRGYVHSDDVVNGGFLQGDTDHVAVQVVYDELAPLDDYEGVDVTPITRELRPQDPLALNLMRITVDGEPIDDPGRSSADIQRCTDVALERADVRFRFDNLESTARLSVTSTPTASIGGAAGTPPVRFRAYTNYAHFIERSEVRIFDRERSLQSEPLVVVPVGTDGVAEWIPEAERVSAPARELRYVLRAYDEQGRFDETAPQSLWLVRGEAAPQDAPLLAGYGESEVATRGISLGSSGAVQVHGRGIPQDHTVWFAGSPVPVDDQGNFVAEAILPAGVHTVEVAVLDPEGNGELFLRDLELERSDWFYVGIADLTLSLDESSGNRDDLQGDDAPDDPDSFADGRLAFFLTGEFGEDWELTASADTREEPIEDLFDDFVNKTPESLFRRIDPDYHYPTFGDDGTVEETAPTSGKFYAKLRQRENHLLWGNFKVDYLDSEVAQVDRGLYGANAHYQSEGTTSFGERRLVVDGFAAEPGTLPSREEFRGTGGSLYWLSHQDLLVGSERVRIEVRDKDSGLVTSVVHLRPELDYDVDYLQGRVLLSQPIASTVADDLLVRSQGLSGNAAWLVVQYEFTPGFENIDALAAGGQGEFWLNDFFKVGLTANRNEERNFDSSLYAGDVTARLSADSWAKLQAGRSEGLLSDSLFSSDGGFSFTGTGASPLGNREADALRADVSVGVADFLQDGRGRLRVYVQRLEAGYSAPGMNALTDTDHLGGSFELPVTGSVRVIAKADHVDQDRGLETRTAEVDVQVELTDYWSLGAGVRNDMRDDDSPVVPLTQDEGERTDAVVQVEFDTKSSWRTYAFGQTTVAKSGDRDGNDRGGVGGAYRASDRLMLEGEVSHGSLGPAARLGTNFQQTEETSLYLNYALETERAYDGLHARRGNNLITGARTRMSDSSSVYLENRLQYTGSSTGLTRTMGMSLVPAERWTLGGNWESGTLIDRQTHAETDRTSGGAHVGYAFQKLQLSSGFEYRFDDIEAPDGTESDRKTWLVRNSFKYQMTPSGRLLGKFNHSESDSSLGDFFDGGYTEGVVGYAFRPVEYDRLNALAKYTYFYNVPTTEQVGQNGTSSQFIQKSHVASVDVMYDLTASWSVGGKYAYRLGQVSLDRVNPDFFDNNAHLYILRNDYRFLDDWEGSLEGRMLHLPDLDERRSGALVTLYRYFGDNFKVGVGYNFTDFSDDLTDLSYEEHGLFLNIIGTL